MSWILDGYVGFGSFLAKIKVFWKYRAHTMIKTTWIIPHKAFEIFGWTFLDGLDLLKLYLHRLPAKAAKVAGLHFGKNLFTVE